MRGIRAISREVVGGNWFSKLVQDDINIAELFLCLYFMSFGRDESQEQHQGKMVSEGARVGGESYTLHMVDVYFESVVASGWICKLEQIFRMEALPRDRGKYGVGCQNQGTDSWQSVWSHGGSAAQRDSTSWKSDVSSDVPCNRDHGGKFSSGKTHGMRDVP